MSESVNNIICPFCNTLWDENMLIDLYGMEDGLDSCSYGASAYIDIEIKCHNCARVIYKKEGISWER